MPEKLEAFLAERAYSPRTEEKHREYMVRLVAWLDQKGISLADLEPMQCREYLESFGWGGAMQHNVFYCLRPYLRWRYGEGHPVLRMRVHKPQPSPQRTLDAKQVKQLFNSIDTSRPKGVRDLAIVTLLVDTGLRSSELCRLKLDHLDVEARSFDVLAKGRKWHHGVFSTVTGDRLDEWLNLRPRIARKDIDTVFVSVGGLTPGRLLSRDGLQRIIRDLGIDSGIGALSPHDFRRTFATLALRNGAPTRLVQLAGGWSKIDMVERYSQALTAEDFEGYFPTMMMES